MRITFNDIPNASRTMGTFPSIYRRFRWIYFSYMYERYAKLNYSDTGYATAFTQNSSQYIAWSSTSASISVEDDKQVFHAVSLDACAVYNDNVQLTITGHRNSVQVNKYIATLQLGRSKSIELCWTDVDKLKFESNGGIPHVHYQNGPHFVLTSVTFTDPH
jgi:hypothetical protein